MGVPSYRLRYLLWCVVMALHVFLGEGFATSRLACRRHEGSYGMMIRQAPSKRRSAHYALSQHDEELQDLQAQPPIVASVAEPFAPDAPIMDNDDETDTITFMMAESSATLSSRSPLSTPWTLRSISIQDLVYTPQTELISGVLVLLSCSLTAFSTLPNLPPFFYQSLVQWEEGIAFFLFLEFLAEWWYNIIVPDPQGTTNSPTTTTMTKKTNGMGQEMATTPPSPLGSVASFWSQQLKYFTKPLVLIDVVVVVLPVVLPLIPDAWFPDDIIGLERLFDEEISGNMAGSGLINLRLLRLLRWQRVLQDLPTFQSFQSALLGVPSSSVAPIQPYQLQLARVFVSIITLLSVSAGLIYTTERQVNPNLQDFFSALYFTLTTLTTVGFGDITPMTPQGKMVVSASILAGIAVLPAQAASLVDALLKGSNQQNEEAMKVTIAPTITSDITTKVVVEQPYSNGRNGVNEVHAAITANGIMEPLTNNEKANFGLVQELELPKLDLQTKCGSCGATTHWSKANYCWSCGSRLSAR